jgi:hypothetical protein
MVNFFLTHIGLFKAIGAALAALGAILKGGPKLLDAIRIWLDRRYLVKHLGAKKYTPEQILFATTYYIESDCQNVDPAGTEDLRRNYAVRENLFKAIDRLLTNQVQYRHTILLADSGMGKTSFVLNYYARNCRKIWSPFKLVIVPLGAQDADNLIEEIPDKSGTVIFLDAFDEDARAIRNHKERLKQILGLTADFRHVLITCRTQFFLRDDEIPKDVVGQMRFDPTGSSKTFVFHKLYLSPFSDSEVKRYLNRRFGFFKRRDRKRAKRVCDQIADLTVRPMILANVPELIQSDKAYEYPFEVYEEIVARWIDRERPFVPDGRVLLEFSRKIAADIFSQSERRGSETINTREIVRYAAPEIDLQNWQMTGRSLLNRTVNDQFKFAHRSIMEYLCILAHREGIYAGSAWTDQMKDFLFQIVAAGEERGTIGGNDLLERAPLEVMDLWRWFHRKAMTRRKYPSLATFVSLTTKSTPVEVRRLFPGITHIEVARDNGNRICLCATEGEPESVLAFADFLRKRNIGGCSTWRYEGEMSIHDGLYQLSRVNPGKPLTRIDSSASIFASTLGQSASWADDELRGVIRIWFEAFPAWSENSSTRVNSAALPENPAISRPITQTKRPDGRGEI